MSVEIRALPNLDDLDRVLQIEISDQRGFVFSGDLGTLRKGAAPLTLRPGRTQALSFRAWIPSQAPRGYEGDAAIVSIELLSEPAGA